MDERTLTGADLVDGEQCRRPRGQGGIETRKSDGACRGHFRDARGVLVRMPWCSSHRDAEEQLQAALEELEAANGLSTGNVTLRTWGPDFLKARELNGGRNVASEKLAWKKHVETAYFIDCPLEAITIKDVKRWMGRMNGKKTSGRGAGKAIAKKKRPLRPLAWQTKTHALNLLRCALSVAIEDEIVDESFANPCAGLRFKKPPQTEKAINFLIRSEIEQLQRVTPEGTLPLIEFAIATALRQGEMRALRDADVHLDAPVPHVTVRYGKPPRRPTKSGAPRDVPLLPMAVRALRDWYAHRASWCKQNPEGLTFPAERGGYRSAGKFLGRDHQPQWKALLRAAGISRHVVWHDLRHTGATALLGGFFGRKWSLEEIQQFLGHADVKTTQLYSHALQETLNDAARATWGDIHKALPEGASALPMQPGRAGDLDPEFDPAEIERLAQVIEMVGCATGDSNARPTAPEAVALSS